MSPNSPPTIVVQCGERSAYSSQIKFLIVLNKRFNEGFRSEISSVKACMHLGVVNDNSSVYQLLTVKSIHNIGGSVHSFKTMIEISLWKHDTSHKPFCDAILDTSLTRSVFTARGLWKDSFRKWIFDILVQEWGLTWIIQTQRWVIGKFIPRHFALIKNWSVPDNMWTTKPRRSLF